MCLPYKKTQETSKSSNAHRRRRVELARAGQY